MSTDSKTEGRRETKRKCAVQGRQKIRECSDVIGLPHIGLHHDPSDMQEGTLWTGMHAHSHATSCVTNANQGDELWIWIFVKLVLSIVLLSNYTACVSKWLMTNI